MNEPTECLEHGPDCKGKVEYHITPNRTDMKAFPRCEYHWAKRLDDYENSMEKYAESHVAPDWFDPAYAGESWDEEGW